MVSTRSPASMPGTPTAIGSMITDRAKAMLAHSENLIGMDSGATHLFHHNRCWFIDFQPAERNIYLADDNVVKARGIGTVPLLSAGSALDLRDVYYVPEIAPLFSVPAATLRGLDITFEANGESLITAAENDNTL